MHKTELLNFQNQWDFHLGDEEGRANLKYGSLPVFENKNKGKHIWKPFTLFRYTSNNRIHTLSPELTFLSTSLYLERHLKISFLLLSEQTQLLRDGPQTQGPKVMILSWNVRMTSRNSWLSLLLLLMTLFPTMGLFSVSRTVHWNHWITGSA